MSVQDAPDAFLDTVTECLKFGRMGTGLIYGCAALFLYDYVLTIHDEVKYLWAPRRFTLTSVTFALSRYPVFATTIMTLLPAFNDTRGDVDSTTLLFNIAAALRLFSIVASEFILAVRTWAIWEKRRIICIILVIFSVLAVVPAAVVVAMDITGSRLDEALTPYNCRQWIDGITVAYIVPYVLTILYEGVTLTLSLIRITRWRRQIPSRMRAPLLDTLWRDGVFYFTWTLVLGFANIGVVTQSSASQFRTGASQLQAVIHSVLSCRVVLHLAGSRVPKQIDTSGCSLYTDAGIQFTTVGGDITEEHWRDDT
ncbi:hypothetical protein CYLTODRAFT_488440 [Cylindrobasidium torrendii FP15055 ss-10]|uniref:DUF6533 domain-containing protein n=1 Tax=Cylindrobasidium torrendii FP15055 ss-10 TaxID=1314674 RepID=A0A0D7BKC9_9AGAR|nr:hypothetical protein CYLTODRAFT_488440 [Cylindrobasidium torrendii FP15055 ss-10]